MFVHMRDQAFFKTLFFSGDRAGDLGQVKTPEILRFPDGDGLLFNHIWGKTLRDGSSNLFDIRRNKNPDICPVRAIDLYVAFAKRIGIDLTGGFLFRSTSSDGTVIDKPFSSPAADARLMHYLRDGAIGGAVSLHSFRSGCAITLALSGTELQSFYHSVSHATFKSYMSAGSPSSVLTGQTVNIGDPGIFYDQCNNLRRFTPAFLR